MNRQVFQGPRIDKALFAFFNMCLPTSFKGLPSFQPVRRNKTHGVFLHGRFLCTRPKKDPITSTNNPLATTQPMAALNCKVTGICNPCAFCTMKEGGHRFGMREMTTGYLCLRQETVSNFQQELVIHYCFIVHLCDIKVDVYFLCFLATYNLSSLNFLSLYSLFIVQLRSWNFLNHFYEDLND